MLFTRIRKYPFVSPDDDAKLQAAEAVAAISVPENLSSGDGHGIVIVHAPPLESICL